MVFCPSLEAMETSELIKTCPECNDFLLYCCHCTQTRPDRKEPCHHCRLMFTDGACRMNGQNGATAGIGLARGSNDSSHLSMPITTEIDGNNKRTSQRAELLAAIKGVEHMVHLYVADESTINRTTIGGDPSETDDKTALIIATDSEYVVKGMTE